MLQEGDKPLVPFPSQKNVSTLEATSLSVITQVISDLWFFSAFWWFLSGRIEWPTWSCSRKFPRRVYWQGMTWQYSFTLMRFCRSIFPPLFFCLFSFCWLVLLAFKTTLAFPSNYQTVSAFRVWFREGSHTRCDCANCVVNMGNVVALLGTCMSLLWQWLVLLGSLSLTNQVERVENEIWCIP